MSTKSFAAAAAVSAAALFAANPAEANPHGHHGHGRLVPQFNHGGITIQLPPIVIAPQAPYYPPAPVYTDPRVYAPRVYVEPAYVPPAPRVVCENLFRQDRRGDLRPAGSERAVVDDNTGRVYNRIISPYSCPRPRYPY